VGYCLQRHPIRRDYRGAVSLTQEIKMIISRKYARALIRANKAKRAGTTIGDDGGYYAVIIRFDRQRVDHYKITRLGEL
jgi:hypothetical protein